MKKHTTVSRVLVPMLALGLLMAAGLLPASGEVAEAQFEVKFTGTVEAIDQRMGGTTWTVEVDEVLFGPPISGQVDVRWIAVPGCQGTFDPGIEVGDSVEVYGMYADGSVDLCPSADYYIVSPTHLYLPIVLQGNIATFRPAGSPAPSRPPPPGG